ncbi:MAG: HPr family phosphocarrier protein [Faecalibacterium sp.]
MKTYTCTIHDKEGLHARPAGQLTNAVKRFASTVTLTKGDKSGDAKKIFKVMGLAVKCGDTVTVTADGPDEAEAIAAAESVLAAL